MEENRFFDFEKLSLHTVMETKANHMPPLVAVEETDSVRLALDKMKEYHIAQIPVITEGVSIGSLEEGSIMGRVLEDNALLEAPVKDVMENSFPVVESRNNIEAVKQSLAKRIPAVLVQEEGQIVGIITKSDLLEFIAS
jgi:cystathionine beta-synthase